MAEYQPNILIDVPYATGGGVIKAVFHDRSIRLYWLKDQFRHATEVSDNHKRVLTIREDNVNVTMGTRQRTWGACRDYLIRNIMLGYNNLASVYSDAITLELFAMALVDRANELWPVCPDCHAVSTDDNHEHEQCQACDQLQLAGTLEMMHYNGPGRERVIAHFCPSCRTNAGRPYLINCRYCGEYSEEANSYETTRGTQVCGPCRESVYPETCFGCDRCATPSDFYDALGTCMSCAEASGHWREVHVWNYKPELIFHPDVPVDPKSPLYIGMEIETSFHRYRENRIPLGLWRGSLDEDLIFVKSDGSVTDGFEIVTHPMQPRWALENFPFEKFDELTDLGALETHNSCGTHIHMNKDSLSTSQLWKLMQIHFRLPDFCQLVGGRGDTSYARWSTSSVVAQRRELMDIVKKKDQAINEYDRQVALNLRNEYTIEMRYMRGGPRPTEIKKNMEWALALYEFAQYITIEDVRNGALDNAGYMRWFIEQNDYPHLQAWIENLIPSVRPIVRSN